MHDEPVVKVVSRDLLIGVALGFAAPAGLFAYVVERQNRELRRVTRRLESLSTTDVLTGLPNRRVFDERIADEMSRTHRYRTPLTVVMIDLDHFKDVNDHLGHQAGDAVLRGVAALLDKEKRRGDLVARLGGEEFVALLPHTDTGAARAWAERVRGVIAAAELHVDGQRVEVTASFGVAQARRGEHDPSHLLAAADRALYAAKRIGRNRVVCAATGVDVTA